MPSSFAVKIAAGEKINIGDIVLMNTSGYAYAPAANPSPHINCGIATATVDNTNGGNGDKSVPILNSGIVALRNDATLPVRQQDIGTDCYRASGNTVSRSGAASFALGNAIRLDGNIVTVFINPFYDNDYVL
ncbi:MAG: hypothetical protein K0U36_04895 [Alphaproteobacteria bacterium]|nr:hypothetical protein [Alphaproteobacteria bacterium]